MGLSPSLPTLERRSMCWSDFLGVLDHTGGLIVEPGHARRDANDRGACRLLCRPEEARTGLGVRLEELDVHHHVLVRRHVAVKRSRHTYIKSVVLPKPALRSSLISNLHWSLALPLFASRTTERLRMNVSLGKSTQSAVRAT